MMRAVVVLATLVLAAGDADTALATYEASMAGWHVISINDFFAPSGSDVQGRLAVGGKCTLSAYSVGDMLEEDAERVDLYCGTLAFGSASVVGSVRHAGFGNSSTFVGNSDPAEICISENCTVEFDDTFFDADATYTDLAAASAALAALDDNGQVSELWTTIYYVGEAEDVNVFTVTTDILDVGTTMDLSVPEGSFTVINVPGTDVEVVNFGFVNDFERRSGMIVFNFFEATSLRLYGLSMPASVLAPHAHLFYAGGLVLGSVACSSMSSATTVEGASNTSPTGQFNLPMFNLSAVGLSDAVGEAPIADGSGTRYGADVGLVQSSSTDPDGTITGYYWEILTAPEGAYLENYYTWAAYMYEIDCDLVVLRLTVTDNDGRTASTNVSIEAGDDSCIDDDLVCVWGDNAGGGTCECWDDTWMRGELCDEPCVDFCNGRGMCAPGNPDVCKCWNSFRWTGDNCEIEVVDLCESGRLIDGVCTCWDPLYWRGDNCEEQCIDYCNGRGSCSEADPDVCECFDPAHWGGDRCDEIVENDDLNSLACYHGTWNADTEICTCVPGWSGDQCDVFSPCYHGTWQDDVCVCLAGWSGDTCDTYDCFPDAGDDTDSSSNATAACYNGAWNETDPTQCVCNDGWVGDDCNEALCMYGSLNDENECQCVAGYGGDRCEYHCRGACNWYGTKCSDESPGVCVCDDNWQGTTCSSEVVSDSDGDVEVDVELGDEAIDIDVGVNDTSNPNVTITVDSDSGNAGDAAGDVVLGNVVVTVDGVKVPIDELEWTAELISWNYDGDADETTFVYQVTVLDSNECSPCTHAGCVSEDGACKDLSHWVLALENADTRFLRTTDGRSAVLTDHDPTTGVVGIKWDSSQGTGTTESYGIVLSGSESVCSTYYSVKGGQYFGVGDINGPCAATRRLGALDARIVSYDVTLSFAKAEGVTPVLVALDADENDLSDCIDQSYDAESGILTATVCRAGAYGLGAAAVEAGSVGEISAPSGSSSSGSSSGSSSTSFIGSLLGSFSGSQSGESSASSQAGSGSNSVSELEGSTSGSTGSLADSLTSGDGSNSGSSISTHSSSSDSGSGSAREFNPDLPEDDSSGFSFIEHGPLILIGLAIITGVIVCMKHKRAHNKVRAQATTTTRVVAFTPPKEMTKKQQKKRVRKGKTQTIVTPISIIPEASPV